MYGYLCGNYICKENVQLSKLPPLCGLEMGSGVVGMVREELQSWIWGLGCKQEEQLPVLELFQLGILCSHHSVFPPLVQPHFQPHLEGKTTPGATCADL